MKITKPSYFRQKMLARMPQEATVSTRPYPSYPKKREFGARRAGSLWGCNSRRPSVSLRCSPSLLLETPCLTSEVVSSQGRL